MKITDLIITANRNLWRNKGRSILTILAIFVGSGTILMTAGVNTGVNSYIDAQMAAFGGEDVAQVFKTSDGIFDFGGAFGGGAGEAPQEYDPNRAMANFEVITGEDLEEIAAIEGVRNVRPFRNVSTEYITSSLVDTKFVVSVQELPADSLNLSLASGRIVEDGEEAEILLNDNFVESLGFSSVEDAIGGIVRVAVQNSATGEIKEVPMTVVGVANFSMMSQGRNWINNTANDELYEAMTAGLPEVLRNQVFTVLFQIEDLDRTEEIREELRELGFAMMTTDDQVGAIKAVFDAITTVLIIFGAIALLAASMGIINTLFMAVQERTREIGLMRAMGLSKGKVFQLFSLEAIVLGFWGSVVGVAIAFAMGSLANFLASETFLSDLPGFTLVKFDVSNVVTVMLVVMFIAFLAGTLPARKASRQDPIDALRYE
ncbi:ABC transporter permease [Candidatus Saccharibacteria bacterium]|nr:ABC transporter permease [Candidatus Saccharibacteria bacterium]